MLYFIKKVVEGVNAITDFVVGAVTTLFTKAIEWLRSKWEQPKEIGTDAEYLPTANDQKIIAEIRRRIVRRFPDGILNGMSELSGEGRIQQIKEVHQELCQLYKLQDEDIQLCFSDSTEMGPRCHGYCRWDVRMICLNKDFIMTTDLSCLKECIDTVIHELRHAFQHKAIQECALWRDFGGVSQEQVRGWALNFYNYIPADLDLKGYERQLVEYDARNFARLSTEDLL